MIESWMVIQTDEVPLQELIAAGFESVPPEMSDDEVRVRYGVNQIYSVTYDGNGPTN